MGDRQSQGQRAVSRQLLQTYWEIGGRIAAEQLTANAGYEKAVMERLADNMRTDMTTLAIGATVKSREINMLICISGYI